MKKIVQWAIYSFFISIMVAACSSRVNKIEASPYGYGSRTDLKIEQVREPVENAARQDGWELSDVALGKFVAKKEWGGGKHNVVVDFTYTGENFTIRYKDSKNMSYNGALIHETYGRFVKQLQSKVQSDVAQVGHPEVAPAANCKDVGGYQAYLKKTGKACKV